MKSTLLSVILITILSFSNLTLYSQPKNGALEWNGAWQFGPSMSIFLDTARNIAFVSSGGVVMAVDITDPLNLQLLNDEVRTRGLVEDITYSFTDQYLYLACGEGGMDIWDVSDINMPVHISNTEILYFGVETPVEHIELYQNFAVVECDFGYVHTVDVTDPANPVQVAFNGTMGNPAHDIHVDDQGYIHSTGAQLYIRLGINPDGTLNNAGGKEFIFGSYSVYGRENEAFVEYSGSLYILDLNVAGFPAWSVTPVEVSDVIERNVDTLFIVNQDEFLIWDISNLQAPATVGSVAVRGEEVAVHGRYAYIASSYYGLNVVDFYDPANPQVVANHPAHGWAAKTDVTGNYAYIAQSFDGLNIVNVSNPNGSGPLLEGNVPTNGECRDVKIIGNIAYMADYAGGFRIIDVSDPTNPSELGSDLNITAWRVEASGDYAFVDHSNPNNPDELRIFSVSDPANPVQVASYPLGNLVWDLEYYNDYLMIGNGDAGLVILDVSDPTNPTEATTVNLPDVWDVRTEGNLALVISSDYNGGLVSMDITDPANPQILQTYNPGPGFSPYHVAVEDTFAVVGLLHDEIQLMDITDPSNMTMVDSYQNPAFLVDLFMRGGLVYASSGPAGMQILKNTLIPVAGYHLDLKVYLEGPFETGSMNTDLLNSGLIPENQPFNMEPWNYTGSETAGPTPSNVVDWILLELRDADVASNATGSTVIARQACFVLSDGSVVGADGSALPEFTAPILQNLFVVVQSRNHLEIMSANPLTLVSGTYAYDFSLSGSQVYGDANGHKEIATGIWGMIGGDGDADGQINNSDKNDVWVPEAGSSGYLMGDFNLDTEVNNADKNDVWVPNSGMGSQVPD